MSKARPDKGDVVLVDVPYLDASRTVRRPAVVVSDATQMSGLRLDSTVRCDRLFTIEESQIQRHLGSLSG